MLYGVNVLYNQDELLAVAAEWTRLASHDALLILVQSFEQDLVNALAHALLALPAGWETLAYENCGAAEARTVVLRRSGGVGAISVPPAVLKRRHVSTAKCGLVYYIHVPRALPSTLYPAGFDGGSYAGSTIQSSMNPSAPAMEIFYQHRGRKHLADLDGGTHHSKQFQHAIDVHRAEPGGDPNYLPFTRDDTENVTVTKWDRRDGQSAFDLIDETIDHEQEALDALGQLYPVGKRLAQSSRAGQLDTDICSDGGELTP